MDLESCLYNSQRRDKTGDSPFSFGFGEEVAETEFVGEGGHIARLVEHGERQVGCTGG